MKQNTIVVGRMIDEKGNINNDALKNVVTKVVDRVNKNIFSNFDGKVLILNDLKKISNLKISHGLNFIPNFAIMVFVNPGTTVISFNYQNFTDKDIDITLSAEVKTARLLIGRLDE